MKNNTQAESAPAPAGGHDATPWVGSDTPLTDQAEALPMGFWSCATVTGEFARRLERERDRLKEELQDLVEYLDLTHLPKQIREQAEEYVKRVGTIEARNSNHYRTAGICHCGTCFCCEVVKAVAREQRKQVAS